MSFIDDLIEQNDLKRYYSLEYIGSYGYAFPKEEALTVVQLLKENFYNILGGDVYSKEGNEISPTDDNWFCDQEDGENPYDYLKRNTDFAVQYINERADFDNYLYNFVIKRM